MAELTADEAAVYDRQLRVWGHETQQKLRQSKVLIAGCAGVAAEDRSVPVVSNRLQIAKNIVLAGVGSITLIDDTPCTQAAPSNFLVSHDAKDQTVAESCVTTLQEMNPLVSVSAAHGELPSFIVPSTVADYSIVILVGQNAAMINAVDEVCTLANVPFISVNTRGIAGWAFSNTHTHNYIVENKIELKDGTTKRTTEKKQIVGVSYSNAMHCKAEKRNIRKMAHSMPVLRICSQFEMQNNREIDPTDYDQLHSSLISLLKEEGISEKGIGTDVLSMFLNNAEEMPAINAVVGGVVANDVIKIVAAKGEPMINNLFMYSLLDGAGWVESLA